MRNWAIFWLLGVVWGSSFLLIKVAVEDLGPLPLVSIRIGLAALFMAAFLVLTGRRLPSGRQERLALLFVGVMNTAVPFTLITWGEQNIDSGLATVLNATVPLWTLIFAHVALTDERFSPQKLLGLLIGFAGVALLASRNGSAGSENSLAGQAAVLIASAFYAMSAVVIRRYLRKVEPLTIAGTSLIVGGIAILLIELFMRRPKYTDAAAIPLRVAFLIGVAQCLSMIPGTSRSAATIMGALVLGLSAPAAAEFSFFLAIPTMFAAGGYSLLKHLDEIERQQFAVLGLGFSVAFVVALVVVAGFMRFIQTHRFTSFAIYRIILGFIVLAVIWRGMGGA